MIKIRLDIWIEDSFSKMKVPADKRLMEAVQMFAKRAKDKKRLIELSSKLIEVYDEINELFKNMEIE